MLLMYYAHVVYHPFRQMTILQKDKRTYVNLNFAYHHYSVEVLSKMHVIVIVWLEWNPQ